MPQKGNTFVLRFVFYKKSIEVKQRKQGEKECPTGQPEPGKA
jgi:hypothetical protein